MKKLFLTILAVLIFFVGCKEDDETITRIEIEEGENIEVEVGEKLVLHIKTFPEHLKISSLNCQWSSSDPEVVSVSLGKVVAESLGDAIITVTTNNNISASCHIVVTPMVVNEIKLDKIDYEVLVGEVIQLNPKAYPYYKSWNEHKLIYNSNDNNGVVKIGDNGRIEAIGDGECTVNVSSSDGNVTVKCKIKVLPNKVSDITLDRNELSINKGESYKFEVEIKPANVADKTIKWISSNDSVATVGEDGTLIGIDYGKCTVTAISSNDEVKAECKVTVSSVRSLELNKTNVKILIGSADVITANILPTTANQNIIWASSDESIATVEKGVVTGVAAGTTVITATTEDGVFSQTCEVTVGGINIFMSAQNGNLVTTFTNGGVFTYVSCEISNNSSADVYVKRVVIDGSSISVGETLSSRNKISKTIYTSSAQNVVWIIEYDGVEYNVNSFWDPSFGGFAF